MQHTYPYMREQWTPEQLEQAEYRNRAFVAQLFGRLTGEQAEELCALHEQTTLTLDEQERFAALDARLTLPSDD